MNNALAALKERENSQRTQRSRLNAEVHRLQEQLATASKTEQVLRAQVQNLETQLALAQHRENERGEAFSHTLDSEERWRQRCELLRSRRCQVCKQWTKASGTKKRLVRTFGAWRLRIGQQRKAARMLFCLIRDCSTRTLLWWRQLADDQRKLRVAQQRLHKYTTHASTQHTHTHTRTHTHKHSLTHTHTESLSAPPSTAHTPAPP